jgi:hypothetical protein
MIHLIKRILAFGTGYIAGWIIPFFILAILAGMVL